MFKNRRLTVLILIISVASVFLFSCGIALPISLSTSVSGVQGTNPDTINVQVLSRNPIDGEMVQHGPSLILVYILTESNDVSTNTINFMNSLEMKNLNEEYWDDVIYPLFNPKDCVDPVFEYKSMDGDVTANLYAFQPAYSSVKLTDDFKYYLDFSSNGLIYDSKIQTSEGKAVSIPISFDAQNGSITVNNNDIFFVQTYNTEGAAENQHLYVFAAITAQGLNNYVSDLSFVGEF